MDRWDLRERFAFFWSKNLKMILQNFLNAYEQKQLIRLHCWKLMFQAWNWCRNYKWMFLKFKTSLCYQNASVILSKAVIFLIKLMYNSQSSKFIEFKREADSYFWKFSTWMIDNLHQLLWWKNIRILFALCCDRIYIAICLTKCTKMFLI